MQKMVNGGAKPGEQRSHAKTRFRFHEIARCAAGFDRIGRSDARRCSGLVSKLLAPATAIDVEEIRELSPYHCTPAFAACRKVCTKSFAGKLAVGHESHCSKIDRLRNICAQPNAKPPRYMYWGVMTSELKNSRFRPCSVARLLSLQACPCPCDLVPFSTNDPYPTNLISHSSYQRTHRNFVSCGHKPLLTHPSMVYGKYERRNL